MKSIIVLTVLLLTCFLGQSQSKIGNIYLTIEAIEVETVQKTETNNFILPTIKNESKIEVARLYKNKNNRVINALKVTAKANKPKMA